MIKTTCISPQGNCELKKSDFLGITLYTRRIPKKSDIYSFNILCGNGDRQIDFEKL